MRTYDFPDIDTLDVDSALAWYVFAGQHYCGQTDPLYAFLCRLTKVFKPGALFSESEFLDPENWSEYPEAKRYYSDLCRQYGFDCEF